MHQQIVKTMMPRAGPRRRRVMKMETHPKIAKKNIWRTRRRRMRTKLTKMVATMVPTTRVRLVVQQSSWVPLVQVVLPTAAVQMLIWTRAALAAECSDTKSFWVVGVPLACGITNRFLKQIGGMIPGISTSSIRS
jgi:hypothetical protein